MDLFVITGYKCNESCDFCLFRFNSRKHMSFTKYIDNLNHIFKVDRDNLFFVKITGGEPFLEEGLLKDLMFYLESKKSRISKIGIGTNGTILIPKYFNDLKNQINIYFSRHIAGQYFANEKSLEEIKAGIDNPNIYYLFNCNLIKGGVDNIVKIIDYICWAREQGITYICFRELNSVNIKKNTMYSRHVRKYEKYYRNNVVKVKDIIAQLGHFADFEYQKTKQNHYEKNIIYKYKNQSQIKFRIVNEKQMISYNEQNPDIIDKYVIHPDGAITGCWDRLNKIIKE